jgi:hypothetical protein
MGFKFVTVAVLAAVFGSASVEAQSVRQVGGPANPPPSGFTGDQFVDNRGCVFLRAGYGGQATWVPRVGRDRKAMCGYPPTGTVRNKIEIASDAEAAQPPAAVMAEAPAVMAEVAPVIPVVPMAKTRVVSIEPAAPVVVRRQPVAPAVVEAPAVAVVKPAAVAPMPRATYEVAAASGPGAGQIGCYSSAPVAERVKLSNGGTAVVCTRGDGTLTGWRPPVYPRGAGVGAALHDPVMAAGLGGGHGHGHADADHDGDHGHAHAAASTNAVPKPPKGYKLAWDDDRLNPNRAKGTVQGWQDQAQVWTNDIPAELVADQPKKKKKKKVVYVTKDSNVTVSTKGQAATAPVAKKAAKGGAYVQVGTFGQPANADGAASRLQGMGLPVARSKITSGGKAMQIILAGPFASADDAQTALSMARRAGFGDAFLR